MISKIFIPVFMLICTHAFAQVTFTYQGKQLVLESRTMLDQLIVYDSPILPGDVPEVILFKKYFNPESFDQYKSFYLPADWGNFLVDEFNEWQTRIKKDKIYLQQFMLVRNSAGMEFLIYQYVMEKENFSLLRSLVLKKVNNSWYHIHFKNDKDAVLLKQLGRIQIPYLDERLSAGDKNISLDQLDDNLVRANEEKFNRSDVFLSIENLLISRGMQASDIVQLKQMFLSHDDRGMIDSIAAKINIEDMKVMKIINEACGFRLYNYLMHDESK